MKKSKSLFAAILAVLSIGLVSCGNQQQPSNNSQTASVKNPYTFDVNGELKEGMTVTLIFKNNGSAIVEQASVVYSVDDASKATVSGNKITFTGNGSVKITATYKGETIEKTVEVAEGEHIYTIAEAKAAKSDANNLIKMRGKVTASLGTSAYISDTTGGAYIYNWLFNNADTAITNKSFTVGQTVDITAFIVHSNKKDENGNQIERGLQISNYNSGSRVSGTSAIVSTTEVEAMKPIELDEAGYKALTYDKVGNLYTFEAEYLNGNPKEKGVDVKFKLGNTNIVLRTNKYDPASPSDTLVAGKKYKITAPLSWFGGAQFAYASSGVSIVEADSEPLEVSYTGDAYVGEFVNLVTTASGVKVTEGVTYTIEEGSNLASLANGVLTITGEGTIKVKATYVKDGKTLTAEVTINATNLTLSKLSELNSMTEGKKVKSRGYVMGYTGTPRSDTGLFYDKVFVADGEDYFILYKVLPEQLAEINVGDLIEFTGYIKKFKQSDVTTYETTTNVITKVTEADSSIVKPTATELTSSSAKFTFGQVNISKAYKINHGVVISNAKNSSGNMTVTFTLGLNEYELFMDKRDYDITKNPFTKLIPGAVFNANVFAAATNFFCPSNIEITGEQEVLTLDKKEGTINIHGNDKTLQLNATYAGGSNTDPIVWSSSAESVATVDQNGLVTGVAVGETTITAKKSETLSVQAKITVVDKNVTTVTISYSDLTETAAGAVNQEVKGIKIEISTGIVSTDNFRVYKGQTLKLTSNIGLMTKVVFTCIANGEAKYGPGNFTGNNNYTAGKKETGTWELAAGASSLTLTASKNQVRITQMEISYISSAE